MLKLRPLTLILAAITLAAGITLVVHSIRSQSSSSKIQASATAKKKPAKKPKKPAQTHSSSSAVAATKSSAPQIGGPSPVLPGTIGSQSSEWCSGACDYTQASFQRGAYYCDYQSYCGKAIGPSSGGNFCRRGGAFGMCFTCRGIQGTDAPKPFFYTYPPRTVGGNKVQIVTSPTGKNCGQVP